MYTISAVTRKWTQYFGCDTKLRSSNVSRVEVVPWSDDLVTKTFRELLKRKNRTLTISQWNYVMNQVKEEPSALYVQLAARVVASWTSYESSPVLQKGVREVICQILNSLESTYGLLFTRAALGFITYAVDGLTDRELIDLLTLHNEVMGENGINEFHLSPRVPSHVWLRLRGEVYGLVMEREGGRLRWFHRQLKEVAEKLYDKEKQYLHEVLSKYFGCLVSEDDQNCRGIALQTLSLNFPLKEIWSPNAVINSRRCVEASHHMLAAGWYKEAEVELCTIEAVYARAKCG